VLVLSMLAVQCAKNPVTGEREFMLLSESQEIELGRESDQAIVAQYGLVDDPELAAYVEGIGQQMVPVSHRPDLAFTFRLLDDPIVNAFALPGGYVYITRGILAYLGDEAALAGVMGHEIGHVTARHGAQRYTEQQLFGLGLGLGSALSETFARYSGLAGTAAQLLLLKYSRDDERQADRLGVEYATKIGYDTDEMAGFFHTLDALTAAAGGSGLPGWASTHPDPGERYEKVLALTSDWQSRVGRAEYRDNRATFLRHIDGIVFGQNPRQGYVDGGSFLHPDLEFRFPVPENWQLINTPTQVQMASPEGEAAILFSLDPEHASPQAAADAFIRSTEAREVNRRALTIGGYEAVRLVSVIPQQQGELAVRSTWIRKDANLYVFHGLGNQPAVSDQVADGFRRLTDPAALAIQPVVVQVVEAPQSGRFADVVADYPIPEGAGLDMAGLALLNGFAADDRVERGTLIKTLGRRR
jgi:predicted Zn-dependent protease